MRHHVPPNGAHRGGTIGAKLMEIAKHPISEYETLAAGAVEAFRSAADALERGELIGQDAEEHLKDVTYQLMRAARRMRETAEDLGVDVSSVHTIDELDRICRPLEFEQTLMWLDAMQEITASGEEYAAPMRELQQEAAQMAQTLRTDGERPSEEMRLMAERSKKLLKSIGRFAKRKPRPYENFYDGPPVSTMITVGLAACKYSRAQSGQDKKDDAADNARRGQLSASTISAAADSDSPEMAQALATFDAEAIEWHGGRMIRPFKKLRDHKPNAQHFLSAMNACGPLAAVVVISAYSDGVMLPGLAAEWMGFEEDPLFAEATEENLWKTARQLVRRGILAVYKVDNSFMFVLTRFGLESLKMPEVQRALQVNIGNPDLHLDLAASEQMPETLLVMIWIENVKRVKLEKWLNRQTGHGLREVVDYEKLKNCEVVIRLPEGYGRDDESFGIMPYETTRTEQSRPTLYVVIAEETAPFEDESTKPEGSLLLFKDELYERRDGSWVKLERTVSGESTPADPAAPKG